MVIVQQLGKRLPASYIAEPRVHLGTQVEIDVATFEHGGADPSRTAPPEAGGDTTTWSPAEPTLVVETELADLDEYEVRLYDVARGRRLVAAIELISPSNKDRAEARRQFTSKCAALLRQGVALVLIDLVTVRNANLFAELFELIGQQDPTMGDPPCGTYATACRWRPRDESGRLEVWNHPLQIGLPLPCLPLWLAADLAIPLDLEASYEQTCRDLRLV